MVGCGDISQNIKYDNFYKAQKTVKMYNIHWSLYVVCVETIYFKMQENNEHANTEIFWT